MYVQTVNCVIFLTPEVGHLSNWVALFKGLTKSIYLHVTKVLYFAVLYIRMFDFLYSNEL
jgi:hypothetical protein